MSGRLPAAVLAVGVVLAWGSPAFAVRYVPFDVSVDGKLVIEASTGDNGTPDADAVWQYLKRLELRPVKGYSVTPDADDPLKATLKGKVVIDCRYGGRVEVKELKLVRDKADGKWKVDPAEVDLTAKTRTKPKR